MTGWGPDPMRYEAFARNNWHAQQRLASKRGGATRDEGDALKQKALLIGPTRTWMIWEKAPQRTITANQEQEHGKDMELGSTVPGRAADGGTEGEAWPEGVQKLESKQVWKSGTMKDNKSIVRPGRSLPWSYKTAMVSISQLSNDGLNVWLFRAVYIVFAARSHSVHSFQAGAC